MYHPSRGGVRGGADQFNWDDVKSDKYRENYLGHSVKAPVGRWQKGKDLSWYSKDRNSKLKGSSIANEQLAAIKAAEEEAMQAALGQKPIKKVSEPLSKEELTEALQRNYTEREGERITGVGKTNSIQAFSATFHVAPKKGVAFQGPLEPNKHINEEKKQSASDKSSRRLKKRSKKKSKDKKRCHEDSDSSSHNGKTKSSKRQRHDSDSSD